MRRAAMASLSVSILLIAMKLAAYLATDSVAMLASLADSGLDLLCLDHQPDCDPFLAHAAGSRASLRPRQGRAAGGAGARRVHRGLGDIPSHRSGEPLARSAPVEQRNARPCGDGHFHRGHDRACRLSARGGRRHALARHQRGPDALRERSRHQYRRHHQPAAGFADWAGNLPIRSSAFSSRCSWRGARGACSARATISSWIANCPMKTARKSRPSSCATPRCATCTICARGPSGVNAFIQFHIELDADISLTRAHEISDAVEADLCAPSPTPRS